MEFLKKTVLFLMKTTMKNSSKFTILVRGFYLLLLLGLSFSVFSNSHADSLRTVVKTRYGGKVKIIKEYDIKTNKLVTKEKIKNGKRVYFIEFNEKGKVKRHINKKGEEIIHKPGCNCSF